MALDWMNEPAVSLTRSNPVEIARKALSARALAALLEPTHPTAADPDLRKIVVTVG